MIWGIVILGVILFLRPGHHQPSNRCMTRNVFFNSVQDNADLRMENIRYTSHLNGKDQWILNAHTARYFREDGKVYLDDIKAELPTDSGKKLNIAGDHAACDPTSGNMRIWGEVSAVSSDEEYFYTTAISYDDGSRVLSTDEDVTLITPRLELEGKGLTYDLATGKMAVIKNVRVTAERY
ncbi:MAG: LPS export ABC transporter periplasmic protein LptC [Pseudomonadota bacterium]